jgi:predicted ATPase/class 3 adenylate cyclase
VPRRPSGTVTFLFTDIESSTRMWEREPDAMQAALAMHDDVLRSAIEGYDGYIFATGGDGFAVAFSRAADALNAAVAAQRALGKQSWPAGTDVRVRMAAHCGEVVERDGDYFGPAVNRAARLMGIAAGGQIVCSHVVGHLCEHGSDFELVDAGMHELRGVAEPVGVFVVTADGLADLPLPTSAPLAGNLVRPATEFVGRVSELDRLATMLTQSRLLTLTGTGGVGKTRLSIELAWRTADEFPDGSWVVELAAIAEPEALTHAAATALSIHARGNEDLEDATIDVLAPRTCLLVLDNCEHVIDAVEKFVTRVLRECPNVTVLATSREPIGVAEERVWRVRSLDTIEGVELFNTRAQYADAVVVDDHERETVLAICERLDGIPLAIELAAARTRVLAPEEVLARLDDRFKLLRGSGRGGVERHQTLQAAVGWSYQLLTRDEQLLFDQCAVFAGTFDIDAVEVICETDIDALDGLSSLADKSMIVAERTEVGTRYRLLETLRQYAESRLDQRELGSAVRDRHLAYYATHMQRVEEMYEGPREVDALVMFEHDWDNVRAAVAWGETTGETERRSALLVATGIYAINTFHRDHADWTTRLIESSDAPLLAARGYAANWAYFLGDPRRAIALADDMLARAENPDDPDTMFAWFGGHFAHFGIGNIEDAARMADGCAASAGPGATRRMRALACAAQIAIVRDHDALEAVVDELKGCAEEIQNPTSWCFYYGNFGMLQLFAGDRDGAISSIENALDCARESGSMLLLNGWQTGLAYALTDAQTDEQSCATFARMFLQCREDDDWANLWLLLEAFAVHLANNDHFEPAAVIFAALEHAGRATMDFAAARAAASARYEDRSEVAQWRERGAALRRDEVVDYALRACGSDA